MARQTNSFDWTEAQIAELTRLWADRNLSAAQIARQMGVPSRMAIIGKARRLGLPPRVAAEQLRWGAAQKRSRKPQTPKPMPEVPMPHPQPEAVQSLPVRLADAESHHCRWLLDGETWATTGLHICGRDKWLGHPYCREHSLRAFQFLPQKRFA